MKTPVSSPLAKLVKEKGFDQNPMKYVNQATTEGTLVFPTIADVIMWLYEKHGVWIEVTTNNNPQVRKEFVSFDARVIHRDRNIKFRVLMNTQINKYTEPFNSPTEAYEAAVEYVLNNLI